MNHKERIKMNLEKFDVGKWNKYTYAHDFGCTVNYVEAILNQVFKERIDNHRWELVAKGVPLFPHTIIEVPEVIEVHPKQVFNLGANKVLAIYESKMNNDEQI